MGGAMLASGCASTVAPPVAQTASAPAVRPLIVQTASLAPDPTPEDITSRLNSSRTLDPRGQVRQELMDQAVAALDRHRDRVLLRDRMYLVDFQKFSGDERLYEVDLEGGRITLMRTSHGRGSDPSHSGYARSFSNIPDSYMSSTGAYATAGANWGMQQGPNVLLDGLEYSNDRARERAIIVHGADYADPDFLAREGKLGRSYGCFSVAHADLPYLRERMGHGRLLIAAA